MATGQNKAPSKTNKVSRDRYYLLYELFQSISSTLEPKDALNLIIDAAVKITGATSGSLILVDWEKQILNIEVSRGFVKHIGDIKLKVGEGITGWVAKTGQSVLVRDVSKDPRYVQVKEDIQSELAVPLMMDGKLIGVVNVDSVKLGAFGQEDLNLLTLLSRQSAQVIRNAQLFDTVRRKVEELSALIKVNKTIASTFNLEKILCQIVERTAKLMKTKICSLMMLSEDGEELILKAQHGGSSDYRSKPNIKVGDSLIGKAILTQNPIQVLDVKKESAYRYVNVAHRERLCSLLSVPLTAHEKTIGVINVYKSTPYKFSEDEVKLLQTFADLCAIAIENARLYDKMLELEEQSRRAERLAAVGELAVGIAHEIRNPLTIINVLFESGGGINERDKEIITAELERMNKIVSHLLDYTKPREPVRQYCDVNQILENALLLLSHEIAKRKIKVVRCLQQNLPRIYADPVQLQQVFLNLLLNSSEALSNGGEISVTTLTTTNSVVKIVIQDNGPGIPSQVRKKLFVPFTTTKPKGLGLGLSIVKRIIEAHNGHCRIQSSTKSGTTVHIELPLTKGSED